MFYSESNLIEDAVVSSFYSYLTFYVFHVRGEQAHDFRCHKLPQQYRLSVVFPLIVQEVWFDSRKITFGGRNGGDEIDVGNDIGEMFPVLEMQVGKRVDNQ